MVKIKVATPFFVVLLVLLLCYTITIKAGRPEPVFSNGSLSSSQQKVGGEAEHAEVVEESCEGVGEEECLMRRTLAAHTDYIYTQKHKP